MSFHERKDGKLKDSPSSPLLPWMLRSSCSRFCCSSNKKPYELRKYGKSTQLEYLIEDDRLKLFSIQNKKNKKNNEVMEPSTPSGSGSQKSPLSPDFVALVKQVEDDEKFARMLQDEIMKESLDPVAQVRQFEEDESLARLLQNYPNPTERMRQIEADEHYARHLMLSEEETQRLDQTVEFQNSSGNGENDCSDDNGENDHSDDSGENDHSDSSVIPTSSDRSSNLNGTTESDVTDDTNDSDDDIDHDDEEFSSPEDAMDVIRTLSAEEINRLPTKIFQCSLIHGSNYVKECHVCMTDFRDQDFLRVLPCFHEFHIMCIDPWLNRSNTCPICRVRVTLD